MNRYTPGTLMLVATLGLTGALSAACSREADKQAANTPAPEVQSQTPVQQTSQPTALTGCLRAGDAADTFVLTASQAKDGEQPATYTLVGVDNVNLREHVGERVTVTGTMTAQQTATAQSPARQQESATGTSGTPTVRTRTDLQVRQLQVSTLNPTGERCDK